MLTASSLALTLPSILAWLPHAYTTCRSMRPSGMRRPTASRPTKARLTLTRQLRHRQHVALADLVGGHQAEDVRAQQHPRARGGAAHSVALLRWLGRAGREASDRGRGRRGQRELVACGTRPSCQAAAPGSSQERAPEVAHVADVYHGGPPAGIHVRQPRAHLAAAAAACKRAAGRATRKAAGCAAASHATTAAGMALCRRCCRCRCRCR